MFVVLKIAIKNASKKLHLLYWKDFYVVSYLPIILVGAEAAGEAAEL